MHLVGFIVSVYHDARSHERKICSRVRHSRSALRSLTLKAMSVLLLNELCPLLHKASFYTHKVVPF
jgi:hypothetical protein